MRKRGRPRYPDVLTPREWEVLALLRENLTNEQIAERLGVTLHAARYHVSEILSKLGVATREEAAAWQPEKVRAGPRWSIAFQIWLAAAAAVALIAVGVLAWGVLRGSGDDEQAAVIASPSPSATPLLSEPATPTQVPAETPPPGFVGVSRPDVGATVRSMQLTDDTGFVLTDDDLLRSPFIRNGERVDIGPPVDITPPGVALSDIRGFRFLDAQHGWLVASGTLDDASQTVQLLVFRTANGGDSWQSSSFSDGGFVYYEDRSRPADIDFIDADHGWVVLDTMATMNSPAGDLFRTDDGGQTWTKLTVSAGYPVHFTDEQTGWQAASPCSTCPINRLYVTHDGGETWNNAFQTPTNIIPSLLAPVEYGLPVKLPDGSLLLPTTQTQDQDSSLSLMQSTDNGTTWTALAAGSVIRNVGFGFLSFVFPDGHVFSIAGNGTIGLGLAAGSTELLQFPLSGIAGGVFDIQFADDQRGWALVTEDGCASFKADCWQATFIEQTQDGGKTWSPLSFGSAPTPGP